MRRILAIVLALLFGYTPIAPALSLNNDAQLPVCCRRAGLHRCRMMGQAKAKDSSKKLVGVVGARCPLFHHPAIVGTSAFFTPDCGRLSSGMTLYPRFFAGVANQFRTLACGHHPKRGPPALSA